VQGLELMEMNEAETCYGFGGTFAVKFPVISTAMGEVKRASIAETDADYVISNDSSCLMQTVGVMVCAPSAGGRALSVLPPRHVVLARRSQMVPDLAAALQRVQEKSKDKFPSFLPFISGSSRTGDIERILVPGARGPRKLTILLLP
jgi:L-lactate utilization protein LutC